MNAKRVCLRCEKKRDESSFLSERGRTCHICRKDSSRRSALKSRLSLTYGMTVDEFDELLRLQGGVCAICKGTRRYQLHVDHDHEAEKAGIEAGLDPRTAARQSVRGLLCRFCNRFTLVGARDDPAVLLSGANYLMNWPSAQVLNSPLAAHARDTKTDRVTQCDHPDRPHHALGMCRACYFSHWRAEKKKAQVSGVSADQAENRQQEENPPHEHHRDVAA